MADNPNPDGFVPLEFQEQFEALCREHSVDAAWLAVDAPLPIPGMPPPQMRVSVGGYVGATEFLKRIIAKANDGGL